MSGRKIFNDPIYGLLYFPFDSIYKIIDHPFFQRLRRISQMGLSNYIFPGAHHTRFHHAIGAVNLMMKAIDTLRLKGVSISDEEAEGACLAILCHDIGHGPFSHALEFKIVANHHEDISLMIMESLNSAFDGKLSLAIEIFKGSYKKTFLHQLVSSQLDVDRLDYLTRDSFYTGVAEGVIGYDRIIKMLDVRDNRIVVEEKGVYSVEKFLNSRRIMYLQVYLHKTAVAVEQMLVRFVELLKANINDADVQDVIPKRLYKFLQKPDFKLEKEADLVSFCQLDDIDVFQCVKNAKSLKNFNIKYLSNCLINRRLFNVVESNVPYEGDYVSEKRHITGKLLDIDQSLIADLIIQREERILTYDVNDGINMLLKNGNIIDFSIYNALYSRKGVNNKYFLCFPRFKA